MAAKVNKHHTVGEILFNGDTMTITIDDKQHDFDLKKISKMLLDATDLERSVYRVSASGYGIHWQLIDEDLSIDGLLGIKHQPSFMKDKQNSAFNAL